jgi:hypothetical protein
MFHWIFDLVLAGGSFYAGLRYGKYAIVAEQAALAKVKQVKSAL